MSHPLTSEICPVQDLVQSHEVYMSRLAESERERCCAFTASLNMLALKNIASCALGSECVDIDKIYQGGFNQIFNLSFRNNNINAIARVNMPFGGGSIPSEQDLRDRVLSEAATLKWLHANTNVPVPHIFTYDEDPGNVVGAAYIIQEKISGRPLSAVWADLDMTSRGTVIRQLASIQCELSKTSFPLIGSLYEDCKGADCSQFHVGSFSPPVEFERATKHRGPWATARAQMSELMKEKLEEIVANPMQIDHERRLQGLEEPFETERFQKLYEAILHLVNHVELLDLWNGLYSISHPDLTTNNVLVGYEDPTQIVGLIDWEGTRIKPWWQTSPCPEFLWVENTSRIQERQGEATWDDLRQKWSEAFSSHRDEGNMGFFLGRLHCLIHCDYAIWATVEEAVDFVKEWRFDWPQQNDPAFGPMDLIMQCPDQAHRANSELLESLS